MRRIRSILGLVAVATLAGSSAAFAAKLDDCHKPPPAWYTAPRLTHTYSQTWGAGYSRSASTHEYSAQRRSFTSQRRSPSHSFRLRDPFGR
jgi:hypothetical protein